MPVNTLQRSKPVRLSAAILGAENGYLAKESRTKALRAEGYKFLTQVRGHQIVEKTGVGKNLVYGVKTAHRGEIWRIALKTAADRRVTLLRDSDGNFGQISLADEVLVVTFDNPKDPKKLQIWTVSAQKLRQEAQRLFQFADQYGHPNSARAIPLEHKPNATGLESKVDPLSSYANLVHEANITWIGKRYEPNVQPGVGISQPADPPATATEPPKPVETPPDQVIAPVGIPADNGFGGTPEKSPEDPASAQDQALADRVELDAPEVEPVSSAALNRLFLKGSEDPEPESALPPNPSLEEAIAEGRAYQRAALAESPSSFGDMRRAIYEAKLDLAERLGVSPAAINIMVAF
jgi:hypothetical protein